MVASLHEHLQLQVLVLTYEVRELLRLEHVSHAQRGTAEVAKVKPDDFELIYASTNHDLLIFIK